MLTEGSCQVKKNPKIREKLGLTTPTHPPIYFLGFLKKHLETLKNNIKNTKKHKISEKK